MKTVKGVMAPKGYTDVIFLQGIPWAVDTKDKKNELVMIQGEWMTYEKAMERLGYSRLVFASS